MNTTYEYINEASIDLELICSICQLPFIDPCCTPCGETFCRQCITNWIQTDNTSCPHCREPLSLDVLMQPTRIVRNMLNRLQVKCIVCSQTGLQRDSFDDHIQKMCPKTFVICPSADITCPWTGQRDQLNQHVVDCRFEPMRPVISQFIAKNQQLVDQVNQQTSQITEQQNKTEKLEEQINQLRTQISTHQNEKQLLKEQVDQQITEIIEQHNAIIIQLKKQINEQRILIDEHQNKSQQLNKQVNQESIQIIEQQNEIQQKTHIDRQQNEKLQPKRQVRTQVSTCDYGNQKLNEQPKQKDTLTASPSNQPRTQQIMTAASTPAQLDNNYSFIMRSY